MWRPQPSKTACSYPVLASTAARVATRTKIRPLKLNERKRDAKPTTPEKGMLSGMQFSNCVFLV